MDDFTLRLKDHEAQSLVQALVWQGVPFSVTALEGDTLVTLENQKDFTFAIKKTKNNDSLTQQLGEARHVIKEYEEALDWVVATYNKDIVNSIIYGGEIIPRVFQKEVEINKVVLLTPEQVIKSYPPSFICPLCGGVESDNLAMSMKKVCLNPDCNWKE